VLLALASASAELPHPPPRFYTNVPVLHQPPGLHRFAAGLGRVPFLLLALLGWVRF
jgi:hypothetical protein